MIGEFAAHGAPLAADGPLLGTPNPRCQLIVIYLTHYGQPETSPSWTERWGRFHRDIDNLPVCNLAFAGL